MNRQFIFSAFILCTCQFSFSQSGTLSGDLQTNLNIFQRDSSIGAINTPQYDNYFTGLESWLGLNYSLEGFSVGIRLDVFNNSNLINPTQAYTAAGIGYYYLEKKIERLTIRGGYFYEQFGSGIVYRSYEDRGLGIDYATFGLNLRYDLNDNWTIKGIAGQEKNLFSVYKPVIKGLDVEGNISFSPSVRLQPGASLLNRTLDQTSIDKVVATLNTYAPADTFTPKYNVYAFSGFYTLAVKNMTWYAEGAYKTHEAIYDITSKLVDKPGNVIYSSLSYSRKGLGLTGEFKRTENFVLRTSPNETLNNGVMDFIPPMSRQNSLRLPARYSPQTQTLGEMSFEFDGVCTPKKGYTIELSYSHINDLDTSDLWREVYGQIDVTKSKKVQFQFGGQYVFYNWQVYRNEAGENLTAITPFLEVTLKPTVKKSVRAEVQYQNTQEDYGSWLYGLLEYNMAPKWSFAVSDMYNIDPNPATTSDKGHYYNFFASYTMRANRFSLAYVRQVAGVNCTGGVCRYEPAFSGLKFNITSSF